jgi:uncharacterized protein YggL (DUF469 family)
MKIIISEQQYRMLSESKLDAMQNLINMAFEQVKENCEGGYYVRSHYNYICDPIEMIEEIKVVDVSKTTSMNYLEKKELSSIHVTVDIHLDSIYEYNNLDNFIYQLQEEVRNIIGGRLVSISIGDVTNKRKEFNW